MRGSVALRVWSVAVGIGLLVGTAPVAAADGPSVKGTFTVNGKATALPYVYVWAAEKGFYQESDPAYTVLFVEKAVEVRDLGGFVSGAAYVELGLTRTAEFGDEASWQVYSQSIVMAADAGGNVSGGTYPALELTSTGPDTFAGRVQTAEPLDFFGDTIAYDLTFSAPVSDPHAPIGDLLPAGGGEPGAAYLAWVKALHSGDLAQIKKLVPPEMAAELESEDAAMGLDFMRAMTPADVTVTGGSSDGDMAILKVEGTLDGEPVKGEVTMQKMHGRWMATKSAW